MRTLTSFVKRHQVVSFYILAYTLAYLALIPAAYLYLQGRVSATQDVLLFILLASFSPMVSAILLTALVEGKPGVVTLLKKLAKWRVNIIWYLVAIYGPLVVAFSAYLILGGASAWANISKFPQALILIPVNMALNIWFGPLGEELGWRGYALPRLLTRHTALMASLIIGVLWSFWHLPLYVFPDFWFGAQSIPEFALVFAFQTTGLSIIFTWLYQQTGGSVLHTTLLHSAFNATQFYFIPRPIPESSLVAWGQAGLIWLVALVLLVIYGPARLSRAPSGDQPSQTLPEVAS